MKFRSGDQVSSFRLPAIDGSEFELENMQGKRYLLCFFRFASCPFCNLRVHELTKHYADFEGNLEIIAVFDSPLEHLKKYAGKHHAPFSILADEDNIAYRQYSVEHSVYGVIRGMLVRLPDLLYSILVKRNFPYEFKGSLTTMPAEFLVDESGMVQIAYYAKDEGDHLDLSVLKNFAFQQGDFSVVHNRQEQV